VPALAELDEEERDLRDRALASLEQRLGAAMEEFAFHRALEAIWVFIGALNGYVDTHKPWELARDPARRPQLERVLYVLGESLRILSIVLAPFLPDAAARLRRALGQGGEPRLADMGWGGLPAGASVAKLSGLFPRVEARRKEETTAAAGPAATGAEPPVAIADFARIDLRVAEVLAAEPVAKSRKLLKLLVSLGTEQRTVVAGVAEQYAPSDLVGKKIVIVANLQPATLMGVESQGMLLAGSADGKLAVLTLDRDLPPGARVK
jgi:methionyl-tRNA synthetase